MKRTELKRKTRPKSRGRGLERGKPLRARPKSQDKGPDQRAWEAPRRGWCAICDKFGWILRHHVVYRQHCPAGKEWDLRNSLDVGTWCDCHEHHHKQKREWKIALTKLADANLDFAFEVKGAGAYDYLARRYRGYDARVELLLAEADTRDARRESDNGDA